MRKSRNLDDGKIISLFLARDKVAIGETHRKYGRALQKFALGILVDGRAAAACADASYLNAWEAIPSDSPPGLEGYLLRTTRKVALDVLRKAPPPGSEASEYPVALKELAARFPSNPDNARASDALAAAVNTALHGLPVGERNRLLGRYFFAAPLSRVASRSGFTPAALETSLQRTLSALHTTLAEADFRHVTAEQFSEALGRIDVGPIEIAQDFLVGKRNPIPAWKLAIAGAVGLWVIATLAFFLSPSQEPPVGARNQLGILTADAYYYSDTASIYRNTNDGNERLISNYSAQSGWAADDYGLYFISGRSLYIRDHASGKAKKVYTEKRSNFDRISLLRVIDGQLQLLLHDVNNREGVLDLMLCLDAKTGDVLWEDDFAKPEIYVLYLYGAAEFTLGGDVYSITAKGQFLNFFFDLQRNGQEFLQDILYTDFRATVWGSNLVIDTWASSLPSVPHTTLLVTPGKAPIPLPDGTYIAGTEDYLFFIDTTVKSSLRPLFIYHIATQKVTLLKSEVALSDTCAFDGTTLISVLSHIRTDRWQVVYDAAGKPIDLVLVASDITAPED